MTSPEAVFRRWLVRCPNDWFMQVVESNTASGIPDVFFGTRGISGWMELKAIETRNKAKMRVVQRNWFKKYIEKGGGVGLLLIKRLSTPIQVDVYDVSDLLKCPIEDCCLNGSDIIFPVKMKPNGSYRMSNQEGLKALLDIIYEILKNKTEKE